MTNTKGRFVRPRTPIDKVYTYDDFGRVTHTAANSANGTDFFCLSEQYTYDMPTGSTTNGHITKEQLSAGEYSLFYDYVYDNNGNIIIKANYEDVIFYTYDSLNQLIRESSYELGYSYAWTYDDAGNILSRKEYNEYGELVKTVNYSYEDSSWGDLLTGYDGRTITSMGGNILSDGIWAYTWAHGKELAAMSNGTTTWSYEYDANGMRTHRTNGSTTYRYVYNGSSLSQMTVGSNTLHFTYDASGKPMAVTENGTTYYYVTNMMGDVLAILDGNSTVVVSYRYDAWGNELSCTGSMATTLGVRNPLRYRGYVFDQETGFYYVSSRYYDPEIGRWISPEPNVDYGEFDEGAGLLGYNVYAYCANNPVMFKDETGESITLACVLIGAGIGLLAGGGFGAYRASKKGYSPSDGWKYWKYVVGYGVAGGAVGALVGWGAGALIAKYGVATAATSITKGGGARFSSFNALKRSLGSAGKGKQWHHIVEQCQIGKSGFSKYWIQNSNNVINISNSVHSKISAHYSSKIPGLTGGKTVRDWLAGQSFQKQYEYGIKILRQFGVKI